MGFSGKQLKVLRRNLDHRCVRSRTVNGRQLSYIEGWYAISQANRIFGFDAWSRETVESRCVLSRENRGAFLAVYTAKVRITVEADGMKIIREGHGSGEGRANSPGEVHDTALKAAETLLGTWRYVCFRRFHLAWPHLAATVSPKLRMERTFDATEARLGHLLPVALFAGDLRRLLPKTLSANWPWGRCPLWVKSRHLLCKKPCIDACPLSANSGHSPCTKYKDRLVAFSPKILRHDANGSVRIHGHACDRARAALRR